jgi:hypothetical protein
MYRLYILSGQVPPLYNHSNQGSGGGFVVMLFSHLFKEMKCKSDLRQHLLILPYIKNDNSSEQYVSEGLQK